MGLEGIVIGITQITAIVAVGVFLWQVFNRRFEGVEARFEGVDARFDKVDAKFDKVAADIDARFERVDARFDKVVADIDARFERVDTRFDNLEAKVEDLAKDHQNLARELSEFRGEMRGRLDALHPVE